MQIQNHNRPFGGKGRLIAALTTLLVAGFAKDSSEYQTTQKRGYRKGKHNGRTAGAFGGLRRAKAHRSLYVNAA